ncbi:hypothetical protein VCR4J5_720030 [Vibrio crassostreae]|uniref:Uncharacterized protein n=1 Tax=Vibrio crassostreae TaxID=246167 RepID=A0A822MYV9_9VIBR|nr:hypothetical protein VCR15J5_110105 [Vibrio crassostreae]CDT14033.1 hypothetical protein VCR19J5_1280029 [Vibrio crassostreae]CDT23966.1 hypothetical protein VCR20J5_160030 [Vibrio crassostreae]CDT26799.1 hypothetical protein VCR9J2_30028 [Vibrio crassostreae]CDT55572.1 hypothetical protein VCR5J5_690108 [Vibrio crassostreae]
MIYSHCHLWAVMYFVVTIRFIYERNKSVGKKMRNLSLWNHQLFGTLYISNIYRNEYEFIKFRSAE